MAQHVTRVASHRIFKSGRERAIRVAMVHNEEQGGGAESNERNERVVVAHRENGGSADCNESGGEKNETMVIAQREDGGGAQSIESGESTKGIRVERARMWCTVVVQRERERGQLHRQQ